MHVAVFSSRSYDRRFLAEANGAAGAPHVLRHIDANLDASTAVLAGDATAACLFVNDRADAPALASLHGSGVRLVALRCAGFNNVDLAAAGRLGMHVARVPRYSPEAVAEHTIAMMLALDRHIHRAYARVREGNFALDGLLGFNLAGRTVGIVGTGAIGLAVARALNGFGCRLLGYDPVPSAAALALGLRYVPLDELLQASEIVTLHCPLTPQTRHLIDERAIARMRPGVMLINTSRGAVVDTRAVIQGLKSGRVGYLGLDVYEEEGDLFFENLSGTVIQDDVFARLLTFPNVLITGHQGFFTTEAMAAIAATTIGNITAFERTGRALHPVEVEMVVAD
jgi:D-lactate dehydrogenase